MHRSRFFLWITAFSLLTACGSTAPEVNSSALEVPEETEETALLSTVHMADPRGAGQLVEGFHGVEQGVWRWTAQRFRMLLQPPPPAPGQPTYLELKFTLPDALMQRLETVTLSAEVNGEPVGSETYDQGGDYTFSKEVPETVLETPPADVRFSLDKAIPAGELDQRELGLVAVSVALK